MSSTPGKSAFNPALIILQRHVLWNFLKVLTGTLLLCVGLYIIVTLMEELSGFLKLEGVPVINFILYFLYDIPYNLIYLLPIAVCFSSVFILGRLNTQNEMIAIFNTGFSPFRLLLPILTLLSVMALIMTIFDREIFYIPHQKHRIIDQTINGRASQNIVQNRVNLSLFGADNKIYFIRFYNTASHEMSNTHILWLNNNSSFKKLVSAASIRYDVSAGRWFAPTALVRDWSQSNQHSSSVKNLKLDLGEMPYHFEQDTEKLDNLSASEARSLGKKYQTIGGSYQKYYTAWYFKMATPFISVIMVLLALPLAMISRRMHMAMSLALALLLALLFFILRYVGESLGNIGLLPPILAGTFAHIFFAGWAWFLWRKYVL